MEQQKFVNSMQAIKEIFICILVLLVLISIASYYFIQNHFLWDIQIDGVSCDFLSIEDVVDKINLKKECETISIIFHDGTKYEVLLGELGVSVNKNRIIEIFEQQYLNFKDERRYGLTGDILVDSGMVKRYLESIPELRKENMTAPQNAYIAWNNTEFSIIEEQMGNVIDFQDAMEMTLKAIKNGESQVDFSSITDRVPDVLSENLYEEFDKLNIVLNTSINYELTDGSVFTLDSEVIKNWVYVDESDNFAFDYENGISAFVEELAIKVNEANKNMYFVASESDILAVVNVPSDVRAQLDKEAQITDIKLLMGCSTPINIRPIYDRRLISDMFGNHIEIDLSRQHIWFYKDGELIVSTPCVTGNVKEGNDTPTGVFFLKNKNRDVYLEGNNNDGTRYKSFVKYWMRIYRGIGLHDASWRSKFGGEIYLTGGSHGCINMPEEAAAKTFNYIDGTIPVIVYKSNK